MMIFFRIGAHPGQGVEGMAAASAGKPYRKPGPGGLTLGPGLRSNGQLLSQKTPEDTRSVVLAP